MQDNHDDAETFVFYIVWSSASTNWSSPGIQTSQCQNTSCLKLYDKQNTNNNELCVCAADTL